MQEKSIDTVQYIRLIKESPEKRRSYLFFAFSLLVSVLLAVFAIRPTILTITRINSEIREKNTINTQLESKINALSNLDRQYLEYKEDFDNLELIFPVNEAHILFVSNIDAILARNGFYLESIGFQRYRGKSFDDRTAVLIPSAIRLAVKGSEINIISLLRDLESLPMYPVVESFSYSTRIDKDGLSSYAITMRVYTIRNDKFYR